MKIKYAWGDLLEAPEKYILHGCNAQGVMGAGVALAIRKKWPSAYLAYIASKQHDGMRLGVVTYAYQDGKVIFNGITQEFYGREPGKVYVDYDAVKEVMCAMDFYAQSLDDYLENPGVPSIAMPKIGAGLGGGDWNKIAEIIELNSMYFQPVVYEL